MKNIIYIDTLFLINWATDFFIYSLAAYFLKREIKLIKISGVTTLGALYAVFMFFPEISFLYSGISKLIFIILSAGLLFGFKDLKFLIKSSLVCLLTSVVFCGSIWTLLAITGITMQNSGVVSNGIFYMELNPLVMLFGILTGIFLTILITILKENYSDTDKKILKLTFTAAGKNYSIDAFLDTGCTLSDSESGYPAIITEYGIFDEDFSETDFYTLKNTYLTYKTVTSEAEQIKAFIPENITDGKYSYNAIIGISPVFRLDTEGNFNAIINPDVINTKYLKI